MKIPGGRFSAFMCLVCTILWIATGIYAYRNGKTGDALTDAVLAIVFAIIMVWAWKNRPE